MNWIAVIMVSLTMFFQNTVSIRSSFAQADKSEAAAETFYKQSVKLGDSNLAHAYIGAALITKGKFAKGIKSKKQYIEQGAGLLDQSILNKPNDIEIRMVRLIIQENLPKVVGYKTNMTEDKEVIVNNYATQSKEIKEWIVSYATKSAVFTTEDKSKLH